MSWSIYRNLQASLYDFLTTLASDESLVDLDGESINFRVGRKNDDDWKLNTISFYCESNTSERAFIGSNHRHELFLIIIDIFAKNEVDRLDLARWVTESINDGWDYYEYTGNIANPDSPNKVKKGKVSVNFLTNTKVSLGQNVDEIDANRHKISINVWIVD